MTKSAPKKKKMGRPPLEQTRERVAIRLLPEEYEAFKKAAAEQGLPATTWMRMVCRQAAGLNS